MQEAARHGARRHDGPGVWRTRDAVRRLAAERGASADQVLAEARRPTRREALRRQAEVEIAEAAADPADRAEVAAAVRGLTGAEE